MGPAGDAVNGSDAPAAAAKPAKPRARSRANPNSMLGVMDEDEDAGADANAAAADGEPADEAAEAQDSNTGEEFAPAAESTDSNDLQTEAAESREGGEGSEGEEAEGDESEGQNALPRGVRKKLSRQAERIERQEDELAELRAKVSDLETQRQEPAPSTAPVTSDEVKLAGEIESLRMRRSRTNDALQRANREGADRVTIQLDGQQPIELSVAEAESAIEQLGDRLDDRKYDLRRLRADRETRRTQIDQAMADLHPWTKDRKHPAYARLQEIMRQYPALRDIPEVPLWIAGAMELHSQRAKANGSRVESRESSGNGNGHRPSPIVARPSTTPAAPPPRPAARATRPAASPMAVNGARAQLNATQQKFAKSGDEQAGKELIGALLAG